MARIMAIDYGGKRTGIAVTDPLQITANGLCTVESDNLMIFLADYFELEDVACVVVGQAFQSDGTEAQSKTIIDSFIKDFGKNFPDIPLDREDESYTSQQAVQVMIQAGLKKKKRRDKALVDKISATLILQRYMERKLL